MFVPTILNIIIFQRRGQLPDRVKKKAKKAKKDHLKTHLKTVKEKDFKLQAILEAPEFDLWKDKVYHKVVTAA